MYWIYISDFNSQEWSIHKSQDGPGIVFNFGKRCLAIYVRK